MSVARPVRKFQEGSVGRTLYCLELSFIYIFSVIKCDTDLLPTCRRHVVVGETPIRSAEFGENAEISSDVIAFDVNPIGGYSPEHSGEMGCNYACCICQRLCSDVYDRIGCSKVSKS